MTFYKIFRVLVSWTAEQQQYSSMKEFSISNKAYKKIINKVIKYIVDKIPITKIVGPGTVVQIDEKMLNYKCKSHRGRSPTNKKDTLCMVEFTDHISQCRCFILHNKETKQLVQLFVTMCIMEA